MIYKTKIKWMLTVLNNMIGSIHFIFVLVNHDADENVQIGIAPNRRTIYKKILN